MANNYWLDRQNRMMEKAEKSEEEYLRHLTSFYRSTKHEIDAVINEMYAKYGKDGKLTFQQLATIDEKRRISRLEAMKKDINAKIYGLTRKTEKSLKRTMSDNYADAYLEGKFNLQTFLGYGASFDLPPTKQIQKALDARWVDEKNYSDRLWDNKTKLVQSLYDAVGQTIARGLSAQQCADMIQKQMDSSYGSAIRLARTEINHICNEGAADAYKDEGIQYYQFMATLDERTSEICASLDGMIFPLSERQPGVNYPPMHPNCRSTVIPVIDIDSSQNPYNVSHSEEGVPDETKKGKLDIQMRVAKMDGEYKFVPQDLTYPKWKEQYIDKKKFVSIEEELEKLKAIPQEQHTFIEVSSERNASLTTKVDETMANIMAQEMLIKYGKVEDKVTNDILETSFKMGLPTEGIKYRLKEQSSLNRKIIQDYADRHGSTKMSKIAANEGDIDRYTFIVGGNNFGKDVIGIQSELESKGYIFGRIKNTFGEENPYAYRGINCIMYTKEGLAIEVQFHTQESFDAKMLNHQYYEYLRTNKDEDGKPLTEEKRKEYLEKEAENNRLIGNPKGAATIPSINEKERIDDIRGHLGIPNPFSYLSEYDNPTPKPNYFYDQERRDKAVVLKEGNPSSAKMYEKMTEKERNDERAKAILAAGNLEVKTLDILDSLPHRTQSSLESYTEDSYAFNRYLRNPESKSFDEYDKETFRELAEYMDKATDMPFEEDRWLNRDAGTDEVIGWFIKPETNEAESEIKSKITDILMGTGSEDKEKEVISLLIGKDGVAKDFKSAGLVLDHHFQPREPAVVFNIFAPKGLAKGLYIDGISNFHGEMEMLLARNQNFRVANAYFDKAVGTSKNSSRKTLYIDLEIVEKGYNYIEL